MIGAMAADIFGLTDNLKSARQLTEQDIDERRRTLDAITRRLANDTPPKKQGSLE